jgi:hypothetical protein
MSQPERRELTRAQFAARYGMWPPPDASGTIGWDVGPDGKHVEVEYTFTDDPKSFDPPFSDNSN